MATVRVHSGDDVFDYPEAAYVRDQSGSLDVLDGGDPNRQRAHHPAGTYRRVAYLYDHEESERQRASERASEPKGGAAKASEK
jgi:hypothetical protein